MLLLREYLKFHSQRESVPRATKGTLRSQQWFDKCWRELCFLASKRSIPILSGTALQTLRRPHLLTSNEFLVNIQNNYKAGACHCILLVKQHAIGDKMYDDLDYVGAFTMWNSSAQKRKIKPTKMHSSLFCAFSKVFLLQLALSWALSLAKWKVFRDKQSQTMLFSQSEKEMELNK